jgi:hypothetical protein
MEGLADRNIHKRGWGQRAIERIRYAPVASFGKALGADLS